MANMNATNSMFGGVTITDQGTIEGIPAKKPLKIIYGEDGPDLTAIALKIRAQHMDARIRDAKMFQPYDVEPCNAVVLVGDWPIVEAAYRKAGIKIEHHGAPDDAAPPAPAPSPEQAARDELTREQIIERLTAHGFKVKNPNTKTETLKKRLEELDAEKA